MNKISVQELKQIMESQNSVSLIDVRSIEEYKSGHIPGAISFPLNDILNSPLDAVEKIENLNSSKCVYFVCLSDRRSFMAANIMKQSGIKEVSFVEGGTQGWVSEGFSLAL